MAQLLCCCYYCYQSWDLQLPLPPLLPMLPVPLSALLLPLPGKLGVHRQEGPCSRVGFVGSAASPAPAMSSLGGGYTLACVRLCVCVCVRTHAGAASAVVVWLSDDGAKVRRRCRQVHLGQALEISDLGLRTESVVSRCASTVVDSFVKLLREFETEVRVGPMREDCFEDRSPMLLCSDNHKPNYSTVKSTIAVIAINRHSSCWEPVSFSLQYVVVRVCVCVSACMCMCVCVCVSRVPTWRACGSFMML